MEEGKEGRKRSTGSGKKKRRKSLFEWSKGEELNLLKKLVEFNTKNISREEFYPFLRNGSLAEVSRTQIFEKIQELKREYLKQKLELRKMRKRNVKMEDDDDFNNKRDEGFELSNEVWGKVDETERASISKVLEDAAKKDIDRLFNLEHQAFLFKSKLVSKLVKLKNDIIQAPITDPTHQ
ncbi:hypothetical protein Csa_018385 [Cucumis sativus]|uniref:Glabrous enhancer-binding protein-like DBD domain-containing protein n=1 Tax=Cucumis sativus TaxID=3659 RepID=A0A0A0KPQ5_CUCSA|nr:hypothetical protein Csa_018385 [Cucumis sativus]